MLPKKAATCVDIQQGIALGFGTLTCYWHITTLKLPDFRSVSDPSWDWLLLDSSVTEGVSVVKMVEAVVIKHLATSYIVCHQLNMSFNSPLVHSQIGVTFNTFPMINCPVWVPSSSHFKKSSNCRVKYVVPCSDWLPYSQLFSSGCWSFAVILMS